MNVNKDSLGERLYSAARYVRNGAILCDVGTDHAKLPIVLVSEGIAKKAYATDINEGPISTAKKNVEELGLTDRIECIRTDGLLHTENLGISDICICGMGGELISRIIGDCGYVKDRSVRLILQPMTHPQDLRKFLFENGFEIIDETLCVDSDKLYVVICAHYTSDVSEYDLSDLYLGKILPARKRDALFFRLKEKVLRDIKNKFAVNDPFLKKKYKDLYIEIEAK